MNNPIIVISVIKKILMGHIKQMASWLKYEATGQFGIQIWKTRLEPLFSKKL